MTAFKHILRLLTVAIGLLLTGAGASAQSVTVYAGQPFTFEVDVQVANEENITWEIYDDFEGVNMAVVSGNCPPEKYYFSPPNDSIGSEVTITWLTEGWYVVKVEAVNDCPTNNMKFYIVEVLPALPTATLVLDPEEICRGYEAELIITFSGEGPWDFILEADDGSNPPVQTLYENNADNPLTIVVSPSVTTTYTVVSVTNADGTNTEPSNIVSLTVKLPPGGGPIYQFEP